MVMTSPALTDARSPATHTFRRFIHAPYALRRACHCIASRYWLDFTAPESVRGFHVAEINHT